MRIDQILEEFEYTVCGGSNYLWDCYGPNARFMDMGGDEVGGHVVFDSESQYVYEVEVWRGSDTYRWIDENYISAYRKEAAERNIDYNIAYDDVEYIDIDNDNEMLNTIYKVRQGVMPPRPQKESEEDGIISIDISDDMLVKLALEAHRLDITLNEYINTLLRIEIAKWEGAESQRSAFVD